MPQPRELIWSTASRPFETFFRLPCTFPRAFAYYSMNVISRRARFWNSTTQQTSGSTWTSSGAL